MEVGDGAAVGAPRRATLGIGIVVRALEGGELPGRDACPRRDVDRVQVPIAVAIEVGAPLAHECEGLAVGRPGRQELVVVPRRQHRGLSRLHVEDVEVPPLLAEVALLVLLELEPVDHDRRRRLGLGRVRVRQDQRDPFAIGCPHVVVHVARERGHLAPFAAQAVEQPQLGVLVLPAREERNPATVGAPTRRALALLRRREPDVARAVPARHPHRALVLILGRVGGRDRVGHPAAVRRDLGITHVPDAKHVVQRERPGRCGAGDGRGSLRAECRRERQRGECRDEFFDHAGR